MAVATLSLFIELKERNEKLNLRSFDEADKDDVEKYLYAYQHKLIVKFVSVRKITDCLPAIHFRRVTLFCSIEE